MLTGLFLGVARALRERGIDSWYSRDHGLNVGNERLMVSALLTGRSSTIGFDLHGDEEGLHA